MSTTQYRVTGMTCAHCETAVRSEVSKIAGVTDAVATSVTGLLQVTSAHPVDDALVIAAVDEAGYEAERVS